MVRDMALINIKRFLNIAEIADYLNNHGENYDMNESYDRNRLNTTIMDLVFEGRLTPLFFYSGNIKADLQKSEVVGNEPWETAITEQQHLNQQFNDYLKITDFQIIKELMGFNHDNYVNIQQLGGFDFYKSLYEIDKEEWFYYLLEISKDFSISFYDLRFPRIDLDKIFNIPDTQELQQANLLLNTRIEKATQVYFENQQLIKHLQTIADSQAKEIADLKAQLEQQANQPCETVLDDEMETKSLNAVSRLVYVLLDMAEYDLSTHSGNGNTSIIARSEKLLQKPLSKKFVSDWIKNAQTAKIEYGKK